MLVVNLKCLNSDGSYQFLEIENIPDDYLQCTVTGEWLDRKEFCNEGEANIVRTNCFRSYCMSSEEISRTKKHYKDITLGAEFRGLSQKVSQYINMRSNSISVKDMIEALSKLNPDDLLIVTQEGYYADSGIASINTPVLVSEMDNFLNNNGTKERFFTIGHSVQNY